MQAAIELSRDIMRDRNWEDTYIYCIPEIGSGIVWFYFPQKKVFVEIRRIEGEEAEYKLINHETREYLIIAINALPVDELNQIIPPMNDNYNRINEAIDYFERIELGSNEIFQRIN